MEKVVVLGASKKEDRYSNMAVKLLLEHEHTVYPVHPTIESLYDQKVYPSLSELPEGIDTLTLYLNPKYVEKELEGIVAVRPKRVIFNPGTESQIAMDRLKAEGIDYIAACTLVMLKTSQF